MDKWRHHQPGGVESSDERRWMAVTQLLLLVGILDSSLNTPGLGSGSAAATTLQSRPFRVLEVSRRKGREGGKGRDKGRGGMLFTIQILAGWLWGSKLGVRLMVERAILLRLLSFHGDTRVGVVGDGI